MNKEKNCTSMTCTSELIAHSLWGPWVRLWLAWKTNLARMHSKDSPNCNNKVAGGDVSEGRDRKPLVGATEEAEKELQKKEHTTKVKCEFMTRVLCPPAIQSARDRCCIVGSSFIPRREVLFDGMLVPLGVRWVLESHDQERRDGSKLLQRQVVHDQNLQHTWGSKHKRKMRQC